MNCPTTLVGRESELRELHESFALAREGGRQIVFVTGEPGIGKTSVVEAFLAEVAAESAVRIGRGQCVEHYGAGEAYLPILDALGRLCREPHGEQVAHGLARYAPTWVAQMPSLVGSAELRAIQRRAQGATRERMLRELTEAVEALTVGELLVLRLEDLHWTDVSTLDWLAFLARRPDHARLLLIGTYRPVEVLARDHPLGMVKQELQLHRHSRELALRRLDEAAVAEYLRRRCPVEAEQASTFSRLAGMIHARTEGNPLFMVNVVDDLVARKLLVERGDHWVLAGPPDAVPATVPGDIRQMIERQFRRNAPREAIMHLERALDLLETLPDTPARVERELSIQIALGSQLMTLKGWAAPEVERAYARARALCERAGDTPQLFPALWGLWLFSWGQGDVPQARRIADDLLARAERTDDRGVRLEAHHALWATLFSQGELAAACDHAARGYALYDPEAHGALATVYGNHDAGACSRLFGGWALGLLGFPERAVESLHGAIALGERSQQPFDLAWAYFYLAAVHQCQGEPAAARARAEAALGMAREHAFGLVSAWATAVRGWAIAAEGQPGAGISGLRDGLAAAQATGSKRFDSYLLGLLGEACLLAGRVSDGLTAVAEGLATVAMTGERFYEAELWRLRGELLRAGDDPAPPEECFVRAREIARDQGSRWLELRAAMSLCRLQQQCEAQPQTSRTDESKCALSAQGRTEAAREMLANVYGGFTEGLETADLREARALLQA